MVARSACRNGPPDAVSISRRIGFAPLEVEDLEDRVVFAVHRQQRGAAVPHEVHHQRTGADKAFLVGECDDGTAARGGERRLQAGGADDRGHDPVGGPLSRLDDSLGSRGNFDPGAGKRIAQRLIPCGIGDHRQFWTQGPRLLGQMRDVAPGGERLDHISVRVARYQFHRVASDRSGRSKNRHMPGLVRRIAFWAATTTIRKLSPGSRGTAQRPALRQ